MGKREYSSVDACENRVMRTGLDANQHAGPLLAVGAHTLGMGFEATDTGSDIVRKIVERYPELKDVLSGCRHWKLVYTDKREFKHKPIGD